MPFCRVGARLGGGRCEGLLHRPSPECGTSPLGTGEGPGSGEWEPTAARKDGGGEHAPRPGPGTLPGPYPRHTAPPPHPSRVSTRRRPGSRSSGLPCLPPESRPLPSPPEAKRSGTPRTPKAPRLGGLPPGPSSFSRSLLPHLKPRPRKSNLGAQGWTPCPPVRERDMFIAEGTWLASPSGSAVGSNVPDGAGFPSFGTSPPLRVSLLHPTGGATQPRVSGPESWDGRRGSRAGRARPCGPRRGLPRPVRPKGEVPVAAPGPGRGSGSRRASPMGPAPPTPRTCTRGPRPGDAGDPSRVGGRRRGAPRRPHLAAGRAPGRGLGPSVTRVPPPWPRPSKFSRPVTTTRRPDAAASLPEAQPRSVRVPLPARRAGGGVVRVRDAGRGRRPRPPARRADGRPRVAAGRRRR